MSVCGAGYCPTNGATISSFVKHIKMKRLYCRTFVCFLLLGGGGGVWLFFALLLLFLGGGLLWVFFCFFE